MIQKLEPRHFGPDSGFGGATFSDVIDKVNEIIDAMNGKQKKQKPISSCDIVPYIDEKIAALQDMWREEKVSFDWDDMKDMIEDVARHFYHKEQKPSTGIYWHAIKRGEKLPCRAYIWNPDYEKYHDCWEGRLIPNLENISVGGDTWYLPADDVKNLPREGLDELQKEPKPAESSTNLDELMDDYFANFKVPEHQIIFEDTFRKIAKDFYELGRKSKPAEWSESDTVMCNAALELLRSHPNLMASHGINKSSVIRWLQSFRPQKQGFIDDICSKAGIAIPYLDGNQWCILKGDNIQSGVVGFGGTKEDALANFIKDVPIPQQWSEEDEDMIRDIIASIDTKIPASDFQEMENWLKSLRPGWKPTEEQMSALLWCVAHLGGADRRVLAELYEHLKLYCK